jgi:hypothetical protein
MNALWATIPSYIALIIALITAMIAIGGLVQERKLTKFSVGANLLVRLEDKYDEQAMVKKRKRAALALLSHADPSCARGVLDFFEEIGILLQKDALDADLVYNEFSYCAISYWEASKGFIERLRLADSTWFSAYAGLIQTLDRHPSEHGPWRPTKEELGRFLLEESELDLP